MESISEGKSVYYLENIWENKSPELEEEIIRFWLSEGVLSDQQARQRVSQVFFVARDLDKTIVGINTVFKQYNTQLEHVFYYYRTYITPRARRFHHMTSEMMIQTWEHLESRYLDRIDTEAIGLFLGIENEKIKKQLNLAVWPVINCVYIGNNMRGDHLRVCYFENARLKT